MADSPHLQRMLARKERLQARLKKLEVEQQLHDARAAVRARKRETRRLILLGRFLQQDMDRDPKFAAKTRKRLDAYLTRPHDRELFGLDENVGTNSGR